MVQGLIQMSVCYVTNKVYVLMEVCYGTNGGVVWYKSPRCVILQMNVSYVSNEGLLGPNKIMLVQIRMCCGTYDTVSGKTLRDVMLQITRRWKTNEKSL